MYENEIKDFNHLKNMDRKKRSHDLITDGNPFRSYRFTLYSTA